MRNVETVIVGGGQAGLSISHFLYQAGREHMLLEGADAPASSWRNARWDSFTLVSPNWSFRLPGGEYDGPDPNGYMRRQDIVDRFEAYAAPLMAHIECGVWVDAICSGENGGFLIETSNGIVAARNAVVATGAERVASIPEMAAGIDPTVTQLHSSDYRNPASLPPGAVLVVGSGQSGAQIADELIRSGRRVFLSVSSAGRVPRRYRGKDILDWLFDGIRLFDIPANRFPFPPDRFSAPHVTGARGGATLNLHEFARDGMRLLGHVRAAGDMRLAVEPDLHESLARADGFERNVIQAVDGYILANGIEAPEEALPQLRDGFAQPEIEMLDLAAEGIGSIVWATGFRPDFSAIRIPLFDDKGFPIQTAGVAPHEGLYFAGFPWMPALRSAILPGIASHAQFITEQIIARSRGKKMARAA